MGRFVKFPCNVSKLEGGAGRFRESIFQIQHGFVHPKCLSASFHALQAGLQLVKCDQPLGNVAGFNEGVQIAITGSLPEMLSMFVDEETSVIRSQPEDDGP